MADIPKFIAIDPPEIVQAVNELIDDINESIGVSGGNVSNTGTPTAGQLAVWADSTTIQGSNSLAVNNLNGGAGATEGTFWRGDGAWAAPMGAPITRAQIATMLVLPSTFMVSGFSTTGDRGAGAIYSSQAAGPTSPMAIQNASGVWFGLVINSFADAGWFGVTGNDVADDTSAAQTAINYITANHLTLVFTGIVKITAALAIPLSANWIITGNGAIIKQYTSNTPIFTFSHANTRLFEITNLDLEWKNIQPSTNTNAVVFDFTYVDGTHLFGVYNFLIDNIVAQYGYRVISNGSSNQQSVWGAIFRNINSYWMTGAFCYLACSDGGLPNLHFDHIYVLVQGGVTISETMFTITRPDGLFINNVEINAGIWTGFPTLFSFGAGGNNAGITLTQVRIEQATINYDNGYMIYCSQPTYIEGLLISVTVPAAVRLIGVLAHLGTGAVSIKGATFTVILGAGATFKAVQADQGKWTLGQDITLAGGATLGDYGPNIYPNRSPSIYQQYSTNSSTSASTVLTAANISGGSEEHTLNMTGAITGASNAQLPTVVDLVAALTPIVQGQTFKLRIINGGGSGAGVWTVTTNTGWTLTGTMTIAVGGWREFYVTLTSLTAAALQSIGTGTNS